MSASGKSLRGKIILVTVAELCLLAGAGLGIRHEIQAVNRTVNDVSDLRDPSPFRAALMGHLGKINVGFTGYLQSSDPSLEKQIQESRKDFETLLPEFVRQNPKLFPQEAADEIKRTFGLYKESIDRTLEANSRRLAQRASLEQNFTHMLYLIDHNIRPIIRKDQADGDERSEAILNIENQLRAWQQNLSQAWTQPSDAAKALTFENDSRGQSFLEDYTRLELLPRERKIFRELRTVWLANSDLARGSFPKETVVAQSTKAMDDERQEVVSTLNRYLPVLRPAELEAIKQNILRLMRLHLIAASVIAVAAVASLIFTALAIYRFLHPRPGRNEPTLEMDLKGTIVAWSPAAEGLYGYHASEMRGKSIGDLFVSESEIGRLGQELEKAKNATFETTHKTKSGTPIQVRIDFSSISDKSGHPVSIGLVCRRR